MNEPAAPRTDEQAERREYLFDMIDQLAELARQNDDGDIYLKLKAIVSKNKIAKTSIEEIALS